MDSNSSTTATAVHNFQAGKDLVVTDGQIFHLPAGSHQLREFKIGRDATVILSGSTTIVARSISTADNAQIVSKAKRGNANAKESFTLHALDASGVRDLKVIANGANGNDAPNALAAKGVDGRDAKSRFITGKFYEVPYWKNERSSAGGRGKDGSPGSAGLNAMDVTMYLPGLLPSASVTIEAVGGNGGKGQPGGPGGHGGHASSFHSASRGGPGANGGQGGNGGDAGKIAVYLIPAGNKKVEKSNVLDWISVRPVSLAGRGGDGGALGKGGAPGGGSVWIPGDVNSPGRGPNGSTKNGLDGNGPKKGERIPGWIIVDVMDQEIYQQYVAQILTKL